MGLKNCGTTAEIKMYKSVNQKKTNKHDKIVLLVKKEKVIQYRSLNF